MTPMTKERLRMLEKECEYGAMFGSAPMIECLSEIQRLRGALEKHREALEYIRAHNEAFPITMKICEQALSPSDETEVTK